MKEDQLRSKGVLSTYGKIDILVSLKLEYLRNQRDRYIYIERERAKEKDRENANLPHSSARK